MALRVEEQLARRGACITKRRRALADQSLRSKPGPLLPRHRPEAALIFSDVGSQYTPARCRELGIRTILEHGSRRRREEQQVLEREAESAPDFFGSIWAMGHSTSRPSPGSTTVGFATSNWPIGFSFPPDHIAETLVRYGTARDKITVIPYAADITRVSL